MPKINANLENEVIEIPSSEHKSKTPLSLDLGKKVTPKSGSHIRNLDFSTPPKLNLGRRKSDAKTDENKAVKSLFKQTEAKAWDADLRSAIIKDETPKKDIVIKKCKKKAKKAKLNITEEDGLLLEAAIKTPVKTDHKKEVNKSEIPVIDTQSDNKKTATQVKTILSPSKLNASKSNIVETKSEEKFITPDIVKEHPSHLIKSNRNITPMLETPFKYQQPPKTPGVTTPMAFNDDGTPFTKMLDANLNGVDISSIETPSLLNTPGFPPNTPCIDLISPYENRPTDYSTGSSYYQPSDNEQNKILEAQIREVEKSSISPKVIIHEVVTVTDHLQIFNKNIIGKKNLNLIKNNMPESEHSQHSYSSSEEERGDSSLNWCDKESNDTIIFKKKSESPSRTYSLRTRSKKLNPIVSKALSSIKNSKNADKKKEIKTSSPKSKKSANKNSLENKKSTDSMCSEKRKSIDSKTSQTKDPNTIIKSDTSPDIEKSPAAAPSAKNTYIAPPGITSSQFSVLKELEKKRKRLVNSLKATTEPSPKHKKQTNGKFKIKPIAKVYTTKTGKKIESQRKRKRAKQLELLRNDLITSDDSELNISLSEDESAEKLTPRLDLKVDKLDKTASDVEAQNLIEGLKERGIHLMHNKTPKKKFYTKEEIINTSDIQLDSYDREVFDKKNVDGEDISIIYDGSHKPSKNLIDRQELEKTEYIGKLYLESIANEIDIHLKQTNFITLIDIKSDAPTSKQHKPKPIENRLDKKEGEKAKTIESKEKKGKNISLQNPTEIYNESERSPLTIQSNEPVCKTDKPKCTETKSNKKASDKAKIIESKDKHKEKRGKTDPQQNPIELHKKSMGALPTNHSNTPACKIDKPKCTESKSDKKAFEKTKTPDSKEKSKEKKGKSGKNTLEPFEESESSSLGNQSDKPKSIETKKECEKAKTIEEKEKSPQQTSIQLIKEHVSDLVSNQSGVDRDDEDLMNFALTGKEKVQEESSRSCKKRRLSDDSESENSRTKMLKTLDVDSFLNTIHHKDFRPKK